MANRSLPHSQLPQPLFELQVVLMARLSQRPQVLPPIVQQPQMFISESLLELPQLLPEIPQLLLVPLIGLRQRPLVPLFGLLNLCIDDGMYESNRLGKTARI